MVFKPAEDFVDFLNTQVASLTSGTNLFTGAVDDGNKFNIPINSTFVREAGGPTPIRSMGNKSQLRKALLDVRTRDENWATGRDIAQEIIESLNALTLPTGYLDAELVLSVPNDAGQDDKSRFIFSVNLWLSWSENTS